MGLKDMYADFKETKEKFDSRFTELEQRTEVLKGQLSTLRVAFNDKLYAEEAGGAVFDAKERDKMKAQMREIGEELEENDTRRDFNRKGRKQSLLELIPGVKAQGEKKRDELQVKHTKQAQAVRVKAAEYLLSLQALKAVESEIHNANAAFISLANEAGANEKIEGVVMVPLYECSSAYIGRNGIAYGGGIKVNGIYGITEKEVEAAYNRGIVSDWVRGYGNTGAIAPIVKKK